MSKPQAESNNNELNYLFSYACSFLFVNEAGQKLLILYPNHPLPEWDYLGRKEAIVDEPKKEIFWYSGVIKWT